MSNRCPGGMHAYHRAMSKWHRREILNDHMRDVNWKKTVGMSEYRILGFSLC